MLNLDSGPARLSLVPDIGGGIAGLWVDDKPVLRPWSGHVDEGPFALASNILVPFSNRIQDEFTFEQTRHAMAPNLTGETFAIHGDGFQKPWQIITSEPGRVVLGLENGAFGPYRYRAAQTFVLDHSSLSVELVITNTAGIALPYGGGFHPWFARTDATRLTAHAPDHWPEGEGHLPTTTAPQALPQDYDFSSRKPLPDRWINCGFSRWNGVARIDQGDDAMSLTLTSQTLSHAVIYSPQPDCGFFCFEPVSHPINAHNLPGMPGLKILQPGQSLTLDMTLDWSAQ